MKKNTMLISLSIAIFMCTILFALKITIYYGTYLLIGIIVLIVHCIAFFILSLHLFNKVSTLNKALPIFTFIILYFIIDVSVSCIITSSQHGFFSDISIINDEEFVYIDGYVYIDSLFIKSRTNVSFNPILPSTININDTHFVGWMNKSEIQIDIIEVHYNIKTVFGGTFNVACAPNINLNITDNYPNNYNRIIALYGIVYGVIFAIVYFTIFILFTDRKLICS